MRFREHERIWQLIDEQYTKAPLSKKTANIRRDNSDCHERAGARFRTKYKARVPEAFVRSLSSYDWLNESTRTADKETCWDPRSHEGTPYGKPRKNFSNFNM